MILEGVLLIWLQRDMGRLQHSRTVPRSLIQSHIELLRGMPAVSRLCTKLAALASGNDMLQAPQINGTKNGKQDALHPPPSQAIRSIDLTFEYGSMSLSDHPLPYRWRLNANLSNIPTLGLNLLSTCSVICWLAFVSERLRLSLSVSLSLMFR